jgi:hypothetical protein
MNRIRRHWKLIAVGASCAALGAGVSAIVSAGAATTTSAARTHRAVRAGLVRGRLRWAVHGDVLVATKAGFKTVTFDRGVVQAVNGRQLTLTEGTKNTTTRTVTLAIPTNARVRDNGSLASLGDVVKGQRATVVQAPNHAWVIARTPRTR